jgi:hypothetical protein
MYKMTTSERTAPLEQRHDDTRVIVDATFSPDRRISFTNVRHVKSKGYPAEAYAVPLRDIREEIRETGGLTIRNFAFGGGTALILLPPNGDIYTSCIKK